MTSDSPSRPEAYWVVAEADANQYTADRRLLRRKIPELGYRLSMGQAANLPEGRYYFFPDCPRWGILPVGKLVDSSETSTVIKCP